MPRGLSYNELRKVLEESDFFDSDDGDYIIESETDSDSVNNNFVSNKKRKRDCVQNKLRN